MKAYQVKRCLAKAIVYGVFGVIPATFLILVGMFVWEDWPASAYGICIAVAASLAALALISVLHWAVTILKNEK